MVANHNHSQKQVVSPFKAILEYELTHSIPPGYINHTISSTAPNGSWQKAERGELSLGDPWFESFGSELQNPERWKAYWHKIMNDPSKRELLPTTWKEGDAIPALPKIDAKEMFWNMMRMARSPDPWMYPALKKLGQSKKFVMAALSNTIAFPAGIRDEKGNLFLNGVRKSEVSKLEGLELGSPEENGGVGDEREDIRGLFEVFVSSAHVGMRKPERRIYELALREIQRLGKERGVEIEAGDVCFLDDIGHNLKAAKQLGMRTIKVTLGKSRDAVVELEQVVGMKLIHETRTKL
ncbi:putative epoxide hydrolase [Tothia fuscella]|uniref:Epoxide hydrolase n=1 Tax=Tothia fuscella TaxID=1048955 RepID=A0A9P4NEZ7_9PEZI|nr:putative epoxide hydrolase [Tothia fuscella]